MLSLIHTKAGQSQNMYLEVSSSSLQRGRQQENPPGVQIIPSYSQGIGKPIDLPHSWSE